MFGYITRAKKGCEIEQMRVERKKTKRKYLKKKRKKKIAFEKKRRKKNERYIRIISTLHD